jgi:hypothetical protein
MDDLDRTIARFAKDDPNFRKDLKATIDRQNAEADSKIPNEQWIDWVTRIAKGAPATPEQARKMAEALIARESERDSYIYANRKWRLEAERLRKIASTTRRMARELMGAADAALTSIDD